MEQDNIIEWLFEKMFNRVFKPEELWIIPFTTIREKTFYHAQIHNIIHMTTYKPLEYVAQYLSDPAYHERFMLRLIENKLATLILLSYPIEFMREFIENALLNGCTITQSILQVTIVNKNLPLLKFLIQKYSKKLSNELLMYCTDDEIIYFYLRGLGLDPNISIYKNAVNKTTLTIIKDISDQIGLSEIILMEAFQTKQSDIIIFLMEEAVASNIPIMPDLIHYAIMNGQFSVINKWISLANDNKIKPIKWRNDLYYSALLSGSEQMISLVESHIPDIHQNNQLDLSITHKRKGFKTVITDDTVYKLNGKTYFSHTMNYAVQSGSLAIVKMVHSLGYHITVSNIITAIKQASLGIVEFLISKVPFKIPYYAIYYLSTFSYVENKHAKLKFIYPHLSSEIDLVRNAFHIQSIMDSKEINETDIYDDDFLLKRSIFFKITNNHHFHELATIKMHLLLDIPIKSSIDLSDSLYLFGNMDQIKRYCKTAPTIMTIMELICYGQIAKLCYLQSQKLLSDQMVAQIHPVIFMLDDKYINSWFSKINHNSVINPDKYFIHTHKKKIIEDSLHNCILKDHQIKKLLLLNIDVNIPDDKPHLLTWQKDRYLFRQWPIINTLPINNK